MPINNTPAELQAPRDVVAAVDLLLRENHAALTTHLARVQVTGGLNLFAEAAVHLMRDVLVLATGDRDGALAVIGDMTANLHHAEPGDDLPPTAA